MVLDLVVAVGNVMVFLRQDTERAVLTRLRALLAPGGRVLAGFHPVDGPATARDYPPEEFVADVTASGLRVDARFGTYELHPPVRRVRRVGARSRDAAGRDVVRPRDGAGLRDSPQSVSNSSSVSVSKTWSGHRDRLVLAGPA